MEGTRNHPGDSAKKTLPRTRKIVVRRWGWSNVSVEDAHAKARVRASADLARRQAGEAVPHRERAAEYGDEAQPIREEVVSRNAEIVITRNRYGALCMNAPDLWIADVDVQERRHSAPTRFDATVWIVTLVAAFVTPFFIDAPYFLAPLGSIVAAIVVLSVYSEWRRTRLARAATARLAAAHAELERLLRSQPWRSHLYESPNGYRVIATHTRSTPDDPRVDEFFSRLKADPAFVLLCKRQKCFRARLTAKPWRTNLSVDVRYPRQWPIDDVRRVARDAWIAAYTPEAERYAACKYIGLYGSASPDLGAEEMRSLHDQLSKARSDKPLA